jgi:hypothetical protein
VVILGVMATFVLARYEFAGREGLYTLFTVGLLFWIPAVLSPAKNERAEGSITKYAKATPARKQNEVKNTIHLMYLRSFGSSPGAINDQK